MIKELEWDSRLFGKKIGRLTKVPPGVVLKRLISKASQDNYRYITCRTAVNRISDVQVLERNRFYMTDVGIVWEGKPDTSPPPKISVKEATIKDASLLKKMSKGLFEGSRFYNDPFFRYDEAERLFQAWVENSLRDKESKTFLVAGKGFIICKRLTKNRGDIQLVGVVSGEQGKGIGKSLFHSAMHWFHENRVVTVTVRTQANNTRAMNFYKGLGFDVKYVDITMGRILTPEDIQ